MFEQPKMHEEREHVASSCTRDLDLKIPTLIDDMGNSTDGAYAALPTRIYLIGSDGRVAYRGGPGPWGLRPDEFEAAVTEYLASVWRQSGVRLSEARRPQAGPLPF